MVHTVIWILIKAFRVTLKKILDPPSKKNPHINAIFVENQQEWDSLMEDITVMKRLMAQISHAVTLIKQRKVTKKKERSKLYKKMQGWRDNLMALLGKYGAQDHKSGVRVMRRALENFKRYKQVFSLNGSRL